MKKGSRWLAAVLCFAVMGSMLSGCYRSRFSGSSGGSSSETTTKEEPERTLEQIAQEEYLSTIQPADDEHDFMFANDYQFHDLIKVYELRDSSAYDAVLGEYTVTVRDIEEVLRTNDRIAPEHKEFIVQYVKDWLALYPESDFRILHHNLKTLSVEVVDEDAMMMETMSTDSAACYLRYENRVLLMDGADFSRESDNYIILAHELTHAARSMEYEREDGSVYSVGFYDHHLMGTYAEEGIITNVVYEMQGIEDWSVFYPLQCNFYRIITDCVGYSGSDFMNHNINYLMYKMDEFMGDEQYAWYIVALIDSISNAKYSPHVTLDFTEYQDLCDYLTRMYMKKYLAPEMTLDEAEQVYADFIANATYTFETMKRPYPIGADNFRPAFEQYLVELGIVGDEAAA